MPQTEAQKAWTARRKEEHKVLLRQAKARPCLDCGEEYPYYVMQFDHVGTDKVDSVSKLVANRQYAKAVEEMKKCEVVCANCHAVRTWRRKHNLGL